ncbi:hypothetical protein G7085_04475 [Tessaracoccus sp. HDW20]|uniref:hypothetical protein n=1 Tax=Tessaracoccus coleopterorum TaxID=2714950 RepID=UPI0018D2AAE0|nr:hypothetical protein [Tessaracoccus coleopterorum]NHB84139.1 hypothetical protein [Tessaracoccus coleopterorum]
MIAKPTAAATNRVLAQTPQEIVTEYFQALADGDIGRALAMGPRGGNGSERLLTPAAFAATRELSRINGLEILTTDPEATRVQVRYRIGDSPVKAEIALERLDTGEYQLKRTTVPIQLDVPGARASRCSSTGRRSTRARCTRSFPACTASTPACRSWRTRRRR